ncbi:MAG: ATP-binding cassette domain-containing protein [Pseudolysinimonas sp.]|uniref:ATP-binding cassette domain-containing protein n=1 Tax=Pseudolysinimonas sp. TaxID=2680009 RepID=UPI003265ABF1
MWIELDDVGISYGDRVIFSGLSGRIPERQLTALVGPSGSGKTSLLAALAGFDQPTIGRIALVEEGRRSPPSSREAIWLPQGANSLPLRSVLDNVAIAALANGLARTEANERSLAALQLVGLAQRGSVKAGTLSGGELQRLAMARGLVSSRSIILADEPSAGLDVENVRLVSSLLRDLTRFATVVVATHDDVLRTVADHVIDLRNLT